MLLYVKGEGSTSRYESTALAAAPPIGLFDSLDGFDHVAARSNLYAAKETPEYFGGDGGRVARATTAPGFLLYRTDFDIASFTILSSFFTGIPIEKLRVYASADGERFEEVAADCYGVGDAVSNWQRYACEATSLPAHMRQLKIELLGTAKAWSPQVLQVSFNRHAASVRPGYVRSGNAVQIELTSVSPEASIYYRLNGSTEFVRYSSPVLISGYTKLEAYAVSPGMDPSPVRAYAFNGNRDVLVDKFGQMAEAKFPEKVTSAQQLATDAAADTAYYASLKPPAGRDRYGGLAGSAAKYGLQAQGYFAIQRTGERTAMTTPEGNLYFSLAVNGITANETFMKVKGREELFEALPLYQGGYKSAFIGSDHFSFYLANKYAKTGEIPTEHALYAEALTRLDKWGFNGVGGFSPEKYGEEGRFPYVRMLPLDGMDWAKTEGISLFDIFAPDAEAKIDQAFRKAVEPHRNDKMLIGYFIGNEYDYHRFYDTVPKLSASRSAIKRKLVSVLQDKYGSIDAFNAGWDTAYRSFGELNEAALAVETTAAWRDMDAFFSMYLDKLFGTIAQTFRRYDPNHLLLGDRWMMSTLQHEKIRRLVAEAEGRYVDVISLNYYAYQLDANLLADIHTASGGKPILISEFGYGTGEQGLAPLLPNSAANQFQRGMRYRNYVEEAASLPYIVGAHVFNYIDQAALGRYWEGDAGERYNTGLVNVTDRPYKHYLLGVVETNQDIYKVMLGERPRFYYDFSKL